MLPTNDFSFNRKPNLNVATTLSISSAYVRATNLIVAQFEFRIIFISALD